MFNTVDYLLGNKNSVNDAFNFNAQMLNNDDDDNYDVN